MTKVGVLALLLGCIAANAAVSASTVPMIERVISPASLVLAQDGKKAITPLDGTPVYYCGLTAFIRWARPLVGQNVYADQSGQLNVLVDDKPMAIETILVDSGWLKPNRLDDGAQAAITEHRGGWNCASTETAFDLMHTSVDPKILAGIAMNESAYAGRPWPWTLNVAGRGYFFKTREGAYHALNDLLSQGRCEFDVGIMQVNWCYHHQRFTSAWDALAPSTNIHVAEEILNENYSKTHSVAEDVAYYNSANPVPGREYLVRFIHHLDQLEAGA